jgi:hypothetical protein
MAGKKGGMGRHFEGWEVGLVAIVIALAGVLLAVPLSVAPRDVPLPLVDGTRLSAELAREDELAASVVPALASELGNPSQGTALYDLRAFGEAFRGYGRAEVSDDVYAIVRARQKMLESLAKARALGDDKVIGLRAYQKHLFLAEVERWENSKRPSEDLAELGGNFVGSVERAGWIENGALAMNASLRGIFFKRRWNEVTGLTEPPFALSLDEQRAFYAFLLDRPFIEGRESMKAADACRAADAWRLRKVEELGRVDPAYPYALARGVLFYRLARYPAAVQAFRDHLSSSTDGRYALRARNYLLASLERANEER